MSKLLIIAGLSNVAFLPFSTFNWLSEKNSSSSTVKRSTCSWLSRNSSMSPSKDVTSSKTNSSTFSKLQSISWGVMVSTWSRSRSIWSRISVSFNPVSNWYPHSGQSLTLPGTQAPHLGQGLNFRLPHTILLIYAISPKHPPKITAHPAFQFQNCTPKPTIWRILKQ